MRFGELAQKKGFISLPELEKALDIQKEKREYKIGEILHFIRREPENIRCMSEKQIAEILELQQWENRGKISSQDITTGINSSYLGQYYILKKINEGGCGEVYKAYDTLLHRIVAIKKLKENKENSRFQLEGISMASLEHPYILKIYELGQDNGQYFLAMEYIEEGMTLKDYVIKHKPDYKDIANIMIKVTNALSYVHQKKIIHRDLKPGNILIKHAGKEFLPKLADFGMVKKLDETKGLTQSHEILGTLIYMAPEQIHGKAKDISIDIYGIGITLYEILVGEQPFQGRDSIELSKKILKQSPPIPHDRKPGIPKELSAICLKAIEKLPQDRYRSIAEMEDDLHRFINGQSVMAMKYNPLQQIRKLIHHYPIAFILILAILTWFFFPLIYFPWQKSVLSRVSEVEEIEKKVKFWQEWKWLFPLGDRDFWEIFEKELSDFKEFEKTWERKDYGKAQDILSKVIFLEELANKKKEKLSASRQELEEKRQSYERWIQQNPWIEKESLNALPYQEWKNFPSVNYTNPLEEYQIRLPESISQKNEAKESIAKKIDFIQKSQKNLKEAQEKFRKMLPKIVQEEEPFLPSSKDLEDFETFLSYKEANISLYQEFLSLPNEIKQAWNYRILIMALLTTLDKIQSTELNTRMLEIVSIFKKSENKHSWFLIGCYSVLDVQPENPEKVLEILEDCFPLKNMPKKSDRTEWLATNWLPLLEKKISNLLPWEGSMPELIAIRDKQDELYFSTVQNILVLFLEKMVKEKKEDLRKNKESIGKILEKIDIREDKKIFNLLENQNFRDIFVELWNSSFSSYIKRHLLDLYERVKEIKGEKQ